MVLIWLCECGQETLIEYERLESRPLDRLMTARGYQCERCNQWKPVFYTTQLLDAMLRKLESYDPSRRDFQFHFGKALRRTEDIQKRGTELWHVLKASPGCH